MSILYLNCVFNFQCEKQFDYNDYEERLIMEECKKRNLTQNQLGELIGVKKSQISKIESGLNNAKIETIIKIFKALQVKLNFSISFNENTEFSMAS